MKKKELDKYKYKYSFLRCYKKNLGKVQSAIRKYSGIHTINKDAARTFIDSQLSEIRRQAAKDLIDNTVYITLEEVSSIVEQLILKT
jgi:hypothetical protein